MYELSRVLEDFMLGGLDLVPKSVRSALPFDVVRNKETDEVIYSFALAGYNKNDIEIRCENGRLYISSTVKTETEDENVSFVYRGISKKALDMLIPFPVVYEVKEVTMENGLLSVVFKKRKEARAKTLKIK